MTKLLLLDEVLRPPPLDARRAVEVLDEPPVFRFAVDPFADEVVRFDPDFAEDEVVRFDPAFADVARFVPDFADEEVFRAVDFAPPVARLEEDFAFDPPDARLEVDFEPPEDFLAVDFDPPPDVVLFDVDRELEEVLFLEVDRELLPELPFFAVDFPPDDFRAVAFPPALAAFFVGVLEDPVDFLAELLLLPELDVLLDVPLLPDDLLDDDLDLDPPPVDADLPDEDFEAVFFFVVAIWSSQVQKVIRVEFSKMAFANVKKIALCRKHFLRVS